MRVQHICWSIWGLGRLPRFTYDLGMTVQPIQTVPEWTLGDRLRKARRLTGMTQTAFAAAIGQDSKAYSQWEADNNRPRHLVEVCQRVEEVTGVSAAWLLGLPVAPSGDGGNVLGRRNGQSTGDVLNGPLPGARGHLRVA